MRDEEQYLSDIVEAAELIDKQLGGVAFSDFLADKTLQQSILFGFTIIGEAANKVSAKTRESYPEIAWPSIIGFRNIIVHGYFSLNLKTVFDAAKKRVLPLAEHVRSIIKHEFADQPPEAEQE